MHAKRTPSEPPAGPPHDPSLAATREVDSVSLVAAELLLSKHDYAESGRREKAARSSYPPPPASSSLRTSSPSHPVPSPHPSSAVSPSPSLPPVSSRGSLTPMGPPAALYRSSSASLSSSLDVYPAPAKGPLFVLLVIGGVMLALIALGSAAFVLWPH